MKVRELIKRLEDCRELDAEIRLIVRSEDSAGHRYDYRHCDVDQVYLSGTAISSVIVAGLEVKQ